MSRSTMIFVAVGLMASGTRGQIPIFKLWVTEVYEVNPGGLYTAKCGVDCPTQSLPPGIAQPGDLIDIEVTVEGWDADNDTGQCRPGSEACTVSAQDCESAHCSGSVSDNICATDGDCTPPDTCDVDRCEKSPLVGAFQWTIDSSTYSNGGSSPGFVPARLPCTDDSDCWCAHRELPGILNDCHDFTILNPAFCTCSEATCDQGVCDPRAIAYFELSPEKNFPFGHFDLHIKLDSLDYEFSSIVRVDPHTGVPENFYRCAGGANQGESCAADTDCPESTCALSATSPYYVGTLLLEATDRACGTFTLDLLQEPIVGEPVATFLRDIHDAPLPVPLVEPLIVDFGESNPCDDGDPCTTNDVMCSGVCGGTPVECGSGETCFRGACLDCTLDHLIDATWADENPLAEDPFDRPGNCAIDARQPHSVNDASAKVGWDRLILSFSCDPTRLAALAAESVSPLFELYTAPIEAAPPAVVSQEIAADATAQTLTIPLTRSISPGFYICISQSDSGEDWCAGYLPADASQNGLSMVSDIHILINDINHLPAYRLLLYASDMNRSGFTNVRDILRLIDLLNGAGEFDPWITRRLPPCPSIADVP